MVESDLKIFKGANDQAQKAISKIYDYLVETESCTVVNRNTYLSFSIGSDLVAVAQIGDEGIDVAIAVPFSATNDDLFDAIELKWRSLPAGITVRDAKSGNRAKKYLKLACSRVRSGEIIEIEGSNYKRPFGTFQPEFKKFK